VLFASFLLPFDDIPAYMEEVLVKHHKRYKISWHLHDLMKRDIQVVADVHKWLQDNAEKKRDVANRTVSRRLLARKIAAEMCLKAASGDVQACKEIMDRTEGKVAEPRGLGDGRGIELHLHLAPATRPLELNAYIEGETAAPQPLDVVVIPDASTIEDPLPEPTSTDSTTTK